MRFDEANALQRLNRWLAGLKPVGWVYMRVLHHLDRPVLKWTKGAMSVSSLLTGMPVVSVTTIGAKSGRPRTLPLIAVPDGDGLVLVASSFGRPNNPAWYHNLRANPECLVVHRGAEVPMVARQAEGDERARLWAAATKVYPAYSLYQQRTGGRVIPVMRLAPAQ